MYQIGDRVIIKKPKTALCVRHWAPSMDEYIGKIMTINEIYDNPFIEVSTGNTIHETRYYMNEDDKKHYWFAKMIHSLVEEDCFVFESSTDVEFMNFLLA